MTGLVNVTFSSCTELLCATERAQLDIWNPQAQACCGELLCNESSQIQVHYHELDELFSSIDDTRILSATSRCITFF